MLDWFHIAMRFEHVLRTAAGVGAGTIDAYLGAMARRDIERAKWCLWHGRWQRIRRDTISLTALSTNAVEMGSPRRQRAP